ncbi:MAG: hypothetical protein KDA32_01835, partial [Phycisphaerales bacterium]|nr:hypothetical protein [Phycisphaerales bacterium]
MRVRSRTLAAAAIAAIAMLVSLDPSANAMLDEITTPRPCSGDELNEAKCSDPAGCTNGCAYACGGCESCKQCCLHFQNWATAFQKCKEDCQFVFTGCVI